MGISKHLEKLLSDENFIDMVAREMVIVWEEFELNWRHQVVDSPLA